MKCNFYIAGDNGIVVSFEKVIREDINNLVIGLVQQVEEHPIEGVTNYISTYHSVLFQYQIEKLTPVSLQAEIKKRIENIKEQEHIGKLHEIPVIYGKKIGEDIGEVAKQAKITVEEVIKRHTTPTYRVYMLGFSPGFPYLGGLDDSIATLRKTTPRLKVKAGSVGIAGKQTGIYTQDGPGGWQIIGHTNTKFFDIDRKEPFLVKQGDRIRFLPVQKQKEQMLPKKKINEVQQIDGKLKKGIKVLDGGLFTTVQDMGRTAYQNYGVPVAGAMDKDALRIGNILLGNEENMAGLEMTYHGGSYLFEEEVYFSLTGGYAQVEMLSKEGRKRNLLLWQTYKAVEGDIMTIKSLKKGSRIYLCVKGGIDAPVVMGSRSTYVKGGIGGIKGRKLQKSDELYIGSAEEDKVKQENQNIEGIFVPATMLKELRESTKQIKVVLGPEEEAFTQEAMKTFQASTYTIMAESDRMGYRLEGEPIEHKNSGDIISNGLYMGAIQVPTEGQPIIMMADCQPTGGYTKIGYVLSTELFKIAQARFGEQIQFTVCSLEEAHKEVKKKEKLFEKLREEIGKRVVTKNKEYEIRINQNRYEVTVQNII